MCVRDSGSRRRKEGEEDSRPGLSWRQQQQGEEEEAALVK